MKDIQNKILDAAEVERVTGGESETIPDFPNDKGVEVTGELIVGTFYYVQYIVTGPSRWYKARFQNKYEKDGNVFYCFYDFIEQDGSEFKGTVTVNKDIIKVYSAGNQNKKLGY